MTSTAEPTGDFGIRVSLPDGDPFANLVDSNWQTEHWFASSGERDLALADMCREHEYSRTGDAPALIFTAVERGQN